MISFVKKREGHLVAFDKEQIFNAIWKAARAVGGHDAVEAKRLTDVVVNILCEKFPAAPPSVEDVQDIVEKMLVEEGHAKTAKAYILYRKSHADIRAMARMLETVDVITDYVDDNDWMVKENSNMGYSLQGLNNFITTKIITNYWLERIYSDRIKQAHVSGDLHIHDLGTLGAYCVGWDLKDLLIMGFCGVPGKVSSKPAKHFRTALGQMVNFFYTLQGESAGAQAFSNVDTLLAPFIRYDGLTYDGVKQAIQEFVFNLAVPTRVGFQTPFTNITLDLCVPDILAREPVIIGGVPQKETYSEFEKEMNMFNRAFSEVMLEGDAIGKVFTFPIPTYNITKNFDWENPEYAPIWEMTAKYGIPYFSNFVNSDMNPEDARSMCCRLRLDQKELRKRGGGLFGANPLTGSIGVVTLNMSRLGYVAHDESDFFLRLDQLLQIAKESLEVKRKSVESLTKNGLYPYSKFYLRVVHERFGEYWKNHFSTIGLVGMNECIANFLHGHTITDEDGQIFAAKVLDYMRKRLSEFQEQTGNIYNLEATPAESTSYRFARLDKKAFQNIIVANEDSFVRGAKPYYTNSTHLPVNYTNDVFATLNLQDNLQTKYTGGTVLHIFVGERLLPQAVKQLVNKVSASYRLPYFTITPTFSICPTHGYLAGDHEYCPKCDFEIGYKR